MLSEVWDVICARAEHPGAGSYVSGLLTHPKGIDRALEKVGEEATEFILAVKNGVHEEGVYEGADLLFHFLVALKAAGIDLEEVMTELASRRRP